MSCVGGSNCAASRDDHVCYRSVQWVGKFQPGRAPVAPGDPRIAALKRREDDPGVGADDKVFGTGYAAPLGREVPDPNSDAALPAGPELGIQLHR